MEDFAVHDFQKLVNALDICLLFFQFRLQFPPGLNNRLKEQITLPIFSMAEASLPSKMEHVSLKAKHALSKVSNQKMVGTFEKGV
ncbi:MAG: hypothetical protein ACI4O5_00040 [Oscillospiraceae bacterium]